MKGVTQIGNTKYYQTTSGYIGPKENAEAHQKNKFEWNPRHTVVATVEPEFDEQE